MVRAAITSDVTTKGSIRSIHLSPGSEIRRLREERKLRPVDIRRISDAVRRDRNCPDFGISHATLNDIENENTVPSVRKMFSLAVCLHLPLEHILSLYGASPEDVKQHQSVSDRRQVSVQTSSTSYSLPFDNGCDFRYTGPLTVDISALSGITALHHGGSAPTAYSYAWVGSEDNTMADLIPAGSIIEIDPTHAAVQTGAWSDLRERPIYFCWTRESYRCAWCQEDGADLVVIPHPASHVLARRYRQPREAWVIGRVAHAWVTFGVPKIAGIHQRIRCEA